MQSTQEVNDLRKHQEIHHHLWNPKIHISAHNNLNVDHILHLLQLQMLYEVEQVGNMIIKGA
jgi:hypothetical protein